MYTAITQWLTVNTAYAITLELPEALAADPDGINTGMLRWVFFGLVILTFVISTQVTKRKKRKEAAAKADSNAPADPELAAKADPDVAHSPPPVEAEASPSDPVPAKDPHHVKESK